MQRFQHICDLWNNHCFFYFPIEIEKNWIYSHWTRVKLFLMIATLRKKLTNEFGWWQRSERAVERLGSFYSEKMISLFQAAIDIKWPINTKQKYAIDGLTIQIYRLCDWTSECDELRVSNLWLCGCLLVEKKERKKSMIKNHNTEATKTRLIKKKKRNCIKNEWIIMKWAHRNRRAWPVVWVQRAYMRLYYTSLALCSFCFDLFFHNAVNWLHSYNATTSFAVHHRDFMILLRLLLLWSILCFFSPSKIFHFYF